MELTCTESLRLDGDRDEEKRQRNRMREEVGEEQEETLQYHQKMPCSHLAEEEGGRGGKGEEGMVGREKKGNQLRRKPSWKSVIQTWGMSLIPQTHIIKARHGDTCLLSQNWRSRDRWTLGGFLAS